MPPAAFLLATRSRYRHFWSTVKKARSFFPHGLLVIGLSQSPRSRLRLDNSRVDVRGRCGSSRKVLYNGLADFVSSESPNNAANYRTHTSTDRPPNGADLSAKCA